MHSDSRQHTRQRRHREILQLIGSHYVRSQGELCELLQENGFEVNQGTLSRDLKELGVVKGPDGYELSPDMVTATDSQTAQLAVAIRQWLTEAIPAQNQVVLKTPPGGAQPLAIGLDKADLTGALGTLAGDDTVLVICQTADAAKSLVAELEALR